MRTIKLIRAIYRLRKLQATFVIAEMLIKLIIRTRKKRETV